MAEVALDPSTITITVYHQCPQGATGSALGPFDAVSYWWASRDGIRMTGTMNELNRDRIAVAVIEAIGASPADAVRAAQDAAAEAP